MGRRPGSSRVICSTRQPGIGQSLFILRSMGSDASPSKPQPRPAQSTQTAGEPFGLSRTFGGAQDLEDLGNSLARHVFLVSPRHLSRESRQQRGAGEKAVCSQREPSIHSAAPAPKVRESLSTGGSPGSTSPSPNGSPHNRFILVRL